MRKGEFMNEKKSIFLTFLRGLSLIFLSVHLSSCTIMQRDRKESAPRDEGLLDLTQEDTDEEFDSDIGEFFEDDEDEEDDEDDGDDRDNEVMSEFDSEDEVGLQEEQEEQEEQEDQEEIADSGISEGGLEEELDSQFQLEEETGDVGGVEEEFQDENTVAESTTDSLEEEDVELNQEESDKKDDSFFISENQSSDVQTDLDDENQKQTVTQMAGESKNTSSSPTLLTSKRLRDFLLSPHPPRYVGKKISIELKNVDIRNAFDLITLESGLNMVLSDEVQGQVSLKLKDVPWDQVLVVLMRIKKLDYIRYGNVLQISPQRVIDQELEDIKRRFKEERESLKALDPSLVIEEEEEEQVLAPLKVKIMSVNFSDVQKISSQVSNFLTQGRGSVSSHKRTNSLVIKDTEEAIAHISKLVRALDTPPRQVLIEGKFIEETEDFTKNFGIRWGHLKEEEGFKHSTKILNRKGDSSVDIGGNIKVSTMRQDDIAGQIFSAFLNIGTFKFLGDLGAQLALLEQENKAEVISSPRIVVMNNESAIIQQTGQNIFTTIVRTKDDLQEVIQRDPIELTLKVTPQITSNRSVSMEIEITRQFVGAQPPDLKGAARPINTREAKTKVLVKDGYSAFIGGIYQVDESAAHSGVPWVKDIPFLGWLFKSKNREQHKNKLSIILTPRILPTGELKDVDEHHFEEDLEDGEDLEENLEEQFASLEL